MEDFKILLYVFGIVIYIIYMAMRKFFNPEEEHPKEQPGPVAKSRPRRREQPLPEAWPAEPPRQKMSEKHPQSSSPPSPPPPTFEEMLRRLGQPVEEAKDMTQRKAQEVATKMEKQGEDLREEARLKREIIKDKIKEKVQLPPRRVVVNYEESRDWRRASDEPSPREKRNRLAEQQLVHPYVALLQNPQDARKAFVLSQILERKEW